MASICFAPLGWRRAGGRGGRRDGQRDHPFFFERAATAPFFSSTMFMMMMRRTWVDDASLREVRRARHLPPPPHASSCHASSAAAHRHDRPRGRPSLLLVGGSGAGPAAASAAGSRRRPRPLRRPRAGVCARQYRRLWLPDEGSVFLEEKCRRLAHRAPPRSPPPPTPTAVPSPRESGGAGRWERGRGPRRSRVSLILTPTLFPRAGATRARVGRVRVWLCAGHPAPLPPPPARVAPAGPWCVAAASRRPWWAVRRHGPARGGDGRRLPTDPPAGMEAGGKVDRHAARSWPPQVALVHRGAGGELEEGCPNHEKRGRGGEVGWRFAVPAKGVARCASIACGVVLQRTLPGGTRCPVAQCNESVSAGREAGGVSRERGEEEPSKEPSAKPGNAGQRPWTTLPLGAQTGWTGPEGHPILTAAYPMHWTRQRRRGHHKDRG